MNAFDMTHLRNMVYFLGIKILNSEKEFIVHQLKYELELLKRIQLMNYKSTITPAKTNHKLNFDADGEDIDATAFKQLVGYLRYISNTRPDICYAVGMMSKFMNEPKWSQY